MLLAHFTEVLCASSVSCLSEPAVFLTSYNDSTTVNLFRNSMSWPTSPQSGQTPTSGSSSPSMADTAPLQPFEKCIVAHALFCSLGFIVLLPIGAIVARLMRTFKPLWFKMHWIIQWALGIFSTTHFRISLAHLQSASSTNYHRRLCLWDHCGQQRRWTSFE